MHSQRRAAFSSLPEGTTSLHPTTGKEGNRKTESGKPELAASLQVNQELVSKGQVKCQYITCTAGKDKEETKELNSE